MSQYHSITMRCLNAITLAAFLCIQCSLGIAAPAHNLRQGQGNDGASHSTAVGEMEQALGAPAVGEGENRFDVSTSVEELFPLQEILDALNITDKEEVTVQIDDYSPNTINLTLLRKTTGDELAKIGVRKTHIIDGIRGDERDSYYLVKQMNEGSIGRLLSANLRRTSPYDGYLIVATDMAMITYFWLSSDLQDRGIGTKWYQNYIEPYLIRCGFRLAAIKGSCFDNPNTKEFWHYTAGFNIEYQLTQIYDFEDVAIYINFKLLPTKQEDTSQVDRGTVVAQTDRVGANLDREVIEEPIPVPPREEKLAEQITDVSEVARAQSFQFLSFWPEGKTIQDYLPKLNEWLANKRRRENTSRLYGPNDPQKHDTEYTLSAEILPEKFFLRGELYKIQTTEGSPEVPSWDETMYGFESDSTPIKNTHTTLFISDKISSPYALVNVVITALGGNFLEDEEALSQQLLERFSLLTSAAPATGVGSTGVIASANGKQPWDWERWKAPRQYDNPTVAEVQQFISSINPKIQEALAKIKLRHSSTFADLITALDYGSTGMEWEYPRGCERASRLGGLCVLGQFQEKVKVYICKGLILAKPSHDIGLPDSVSEKKGLYHNWTLLEIEENLYYLSWTDGLFAWNMDEERAKLLNRIVDNDDMNDFIAQFVQRYRQEGFDAAVLLPWEEIKQYFVDCEFIPFFREHDAEMLNQVVGCSDQKIEALVEKGQDVLTRQGNKVNDTVRAIFMQSKQIPVVKPSVGGENAMVPFSGFLDLRGKAFEMLSVLLRHISSGAKEFSITIKDDDGNSMAYAGDSSIEPLKALIQKLQGNPDGYIVVSGQELFGIDTEGSVVIVNIVYHANLSEIATPEEIHEVYRGIEITLSTIFPEKGVLQTS